MKIRFNKNHLDFKAGQEYEVPKHLGTYLVRTKTAKEVVEKGKTIAAPKAEIEPKAKAKAAPKAQAKAEIEPKAKAKAAPKAQAKAEIEPKAETLPETKSELSDAELDELLK